MVRPFAQAVKLFVGDNHNKLWMKSKRPQEVTGLAKAYSRNRLAFASYMITQVYHTHTIAIYSALPRATPSGYSGPDETGNGVERAWNTSASW